MKMSHCVEQVLIGGYWIDPCIQHSEMLILEAKIMLTATRKMEMIVNFFQELTRLARSRG
jgi:hypothetical protein